MHQTVREFFRPNGPTSQSILQVDSNEAQRRISTACIRYLMLCTAKTSSIDQQAGSNSWKPENFEAYAKYLKGRPFLKYVLENTKRHLQKCGQIAQDSKLVSQLCEKLNESPTAVFLLGNWIDQDWRQRVTTCQEISYGEDFRTELLHTATRMKYPQVVEALLIAGAQVEACLDGKTPLMVTAEIGDLATARLLLDRGALTAMKDGKKQTALHLAAANGHSSVASLLIDRGAEKEAKNAEKQTALHLAAANGHSTVVRLLIDRSADKEAKDTEKQTALHLAAANGHNSTLKLLVDKGADKEAKDVLGWKALHTAAWNGHEATILMLVQNLGASKEGRDEWGWTALHVAVMNGCDAASRLLVQDLGADKEAKDDVGWTALHFAAALGLEDTAQLLIKTLDVDRDAEDDERETAQDLAQEW